MPSLGERVRNNRVALSRARRRSDCPIAEPDSSAPFTAVRASTCPLIPPGFLVQSSRGHRALRPERTHTMECTARPEKPGIDETVALHRGKPLPPDGSAARSVSRFNEAAALRRGKLDLMRRPTIRRSRSFNEAAALRRGKRGDGSAPRWTTCTGFNEAAALRRGKHVGPLLFSERASCLASMRPRHYAAENWYRQPDRCYSRSGFNEAAALRRGKRSGRVVASGFGRYLRLQ